MEESLTRHQRKLLRKQEREKEQAQAIKKRAPVGTIVGIIVAVVVVVGGGYGIWSAGKNAGKNAPASTTNGAPATTYTAGPVHWHAKIELSVCGEARDLPGSKSGQMVGSPQYHHHGDNTWHIEGRIISKDDIKLGRFFDEHDIAFDRDRIMDKKNGDECAPGKPGQVKMLVNGQPNTEFRDFVGKYTPEAQDNLIRIVFE